MHLHLSHLSQHTGTPERIILGAAATGTLWTAAMIALAIRVRF